MIEVFVAAITTFGTIVVAFVGAGALLRPAYRKHARRLEGIDRAVNNVPPGSPRLIDQVRDIRQCMKVEASHSARHRKWTEGTLCGVANHVGYDADDPPEVPVELKRKDT